MNKLLYKTLVLANISQHAMINGYMSKITSTSCETQVRVIRGVSPESRWLNSIKHALWERFGRQIQLVDQPTLTMLGNGELSSMQQRYRDIGSLSVHQLVEIFNDNRPDSFNQPLFADTRELYVRHVRQYTDGVPKLALGFNDAQLSRERMTFTDALDKSLGESHPWNKKYTPNLSIAEVVGNIPFAELLDGLSDFQIPKLKLLAGDIIEPS